MAEVQLIIESNYTPIKEKKEKKELLELAWQSSG